MKLLLLTALVGLALAACDVRTANQAAGVPAGYLCTGTCVSTGNAAITAGLNSGIACADGWSGTQTLLAATDCTGAGTTGKWTFTGCTATKCTGANGDAPAGGTVSYSATDTHTSVATFGCLAGYKKVQGTTSTCAAATADGTWPAPTTATTCTEWACASPTVATTKCKTCQATADKTKAEDCKTCNAGDYLFDASTPATRACKACTALSPADAKAGAWGVGVTCGADGAPTLAACVAAYYIKGAAAKIPVSVCTATKAAVATEVAAKNGVCTACAGKATGCKTAPAGTCSSVAGDLDKLKCTVAADDWYLVGEVPTKCSSVANQAGGATWKAGGGACEILTCGDNYLKSGATTATKCTENVCTKGDADAGYKAGGILAVAASDMVAMKVTCAETGVDSTAATYKAAVTKVDVKAANLATLVAGLGKVECATGYTGTAKATCPTKDGKFTYAGCTKSSAALAQTMIGFVLTIIAMYL